MEHLSSCYFCGSALEQPLETYLVDNDSSDESGVRVTLCSACRRKLDAVLEVSTDASIKTAENTANYTTTAGTEESCGSEIRESDTDEDVASDPDQADDIQSDSDSAEEASVIEADELSERAQELDKELEEELEAELTRNADSVEISTDGDSDLDEHPVEEDSFDWQEKTSEDDVEDPLKDKMEPTVPDEFASTTQTEEPPESEDDSAGEQDLIESEDDSVDEADTEAEPTEFEDGDSDSEQRTEEGTSEQKDSPRTTISALEYNKVMRLLQNREFPVERAEIESIAASAYSLSEDECAQVIDLAVDRGLLDQREGMLHRPS